MQEKPFQVEFKGQFKHAPFEKINPELQIQLIPFQNELLGHIEQIPFIKNCFSGQTQEYVAEFHKLPPLQEKTWTQFPLTKAKPSSHVQFPFIKT